MTLFDQVTDDAPSNALKISSTSSVPFSKNQLLFNKLTRTIEKLQTDIIEQEVLFNKLLKVYYADVKPLELEIARNNIKLAMIIGNATKKIKFSKKQLQSIREVIIDICSESFVMIEPTPEIESFYNEWSEVSYQEEVGQQMENAKQNVSNHIKNMFGIDIDMEDLENNPESFAKIQERIAQEMEKKHQKEGKSSSAKTKKQIEKEQQLKQEEEIKNKSIRSIYLTLAKVLHPDIETDPELKWEKEELMKRLTVAYENKDMATLLKLEMEWVVKENNKLQLLPEEKLQVYISALKEQVSELKDEKFNLKMDPRFFEIKPFVSKKETLALRHLYELKQTNKNFNKELVEFVTELDKSNSKNKIIEYVNTYIETNMDFSFDDFFY